MLEQCFIRLHLPNPKLMCGSVTGNCEWFCSLPSCWFYLQVFISHYCSLDANALLGVCEFLIAHKVAVVSMGGIIMLLEKWQMKHFQMCSKKCITYLISNLLSCSVSMRRHFGVNLSFIASKLYSVSSYWSKQASSLIYGATRRWYCLGKVDKRHVVWFYSFSFTLFCQLCWSLLINLQICS